MINAADCDQSTYKYLFKYGATRGAELCLLEGTVPGLASCISYKTVWVISLTKPDGRSLSTAPASIVQDSSVSKAKVSPLL